MSIISIPFTFSPGQTIVSSQVNSCFSTIYNDYNGSIGNSNLSSSIVITDSKLAQITSASKVSATAITGMASLPSGAGVIPVANLPVGTSVGNIVELVSGTAGSAIVPVQNIGSLFGVPVSKSIGTIYQAATDGVVEAYGTYSSGSFAFTGLTDSSASPSTTVVTVVSVSGEPAAVTFIVRKGNYYQVTANQSLSPSGMTFTPMGS